MQGSRQWHTVAMEITGFMQPDEFWAAFPSDAVALVAITDIEPLLDSRRAMLRRMRGEG